MSPDHVELRAMAEAAYGALNSGDVERFLALVAEDVEFTSIVAEAEATTFRGHDGVRDWWATVPGAFEDVRWTLLDVRGRGERGVAKVHMAATVGGLAVDLTVWQGAKLRDGKLEWWGFFRTEDEALDAIGLGK
jgi:ketosteroid isomerase-like protein